jgi:hypothetical protein
MTAGVVHVTNPTPASAVPTQGQMSAYFPKMERDMYPTLKRGWIFWVPAVGLYKLNPLDP